MKIKDLSRVDLPREKLEKYGYSKLADYELLAILLGSGIKGTNVLELSQKVLRCVKDAGVNKIKQEDLSSIRGLGRTKAAQIVALIELGSRLSNTESPEILSALDVWKQCSDIKDSKREHFVAFYLDTQNRLIDRQIISIGTLNASLVHPREVFEPALTLHAASVVVAHNHPSGALIPSEDDLRVTKRLKEAGILLGVRLLDHVIVTAKQQESFENINML
jgi:DNA repair protein RadC